MVLGVGIWLALFSPVFAARQVVVNGTDLLTPEQVTEARLRRLRRDLARISDLLTDAYLR